MPLDKTAIVAEKAPAPEPSFGTKVWDEIRLAGGAIEHIPDGIWKQIVTFRHDPAQLGLDVGIGLALGLVETVTHEPLPEVDDQLPKFGALLNKLPRVGTDWKVVQGARKIFPWALAGYGAYSVTAQPIADMWKNPSHLHADQELLGDNAGEALGQFAVLLPFGALTSTKGLNKYASIRSALRK